MALDNISGTGTVTSLAETSALAFESVDFLKLTFTPSLVTAVQDASHVNYNFVDTTLSNYVSVMVMCSYGSDNAVCTDVLFESDSFETQVVTSAATGSIAAIPVIQAGSGSATASGVTSTSTSSDAMSVVASGFASVAALIFGLALVF